MTDQVDADREATAVHEAGHFVVAYVRGAPLYRVTIVQKGEYRGRADCGWAVEERSRSLLHWQPEELRPYNTEETGWIDDQIRIAFGGPEAEAHHLGRRDDDRARFDDVRVQELVRTMDMEYLGAEVPDGASGPADEGYLRQRRLKTLERDARTIVTDRWDLVIKLADALLDHETLTGEQAREILG